ncbi:MAG: hypothetical protein HZC24_05695 [Rhodocyclales bacterium]|nr:hypothetical protein [Rhodocyclales bacterium]
MSNPCRHLLLLLLPPLLAACTSQVGAPVVRRDVGGSVETKSSAAQPVGVIAVPPVGAAGSGKPGPIPVRALNVATQCEFSDETGAHGRMALQIEAASVKRFTAEVNIPRRGVCNFDLARFRQTETMPTPVLVSNDTPCRVYVWEQGSAVTVAFNSCEANCTADAYSYLWPILVDPSGKCA